MAPHHLIGYIHVTKFGLVAKPLVLHSLVFCQNTIFHRSLLLATVYLIATADFVTEFTLLAHRRFLALTSLCLLKHATSINVILGHGAIPLSVRK
jgi:hypothetical protein